MSSYKEKAEINRMISDDFCSKDPRRSCAEVSRLYFAALLYVRGYLASHGKDVPEVHHRKKTDDKGCTIAFSIWETAMNTLDSGRDDEYEALEEFERTHRMLRNHADYDKDNNKLTDKKINKLREHVNILFERLEYV